MGQVLGPDNIPPIVKASATTLTLATTYLGKTTRITVGGQQYVPAAILTLNFATVGFNGIDTGVISATSAVYNIYAVVSGVTLGLIASLADESTGPSGFTTFKKVGEIYASSSTLLDPPVATTTTTAVSDTADANVTWSSSYDRHIVVSGITASRDRTLPSTGINIGDEFRIENMAAFDLVIRSSNGTAMTVANGANIDATIRSGFVLLRATQTTPTTPAHWRVVDLLENYLFSSTISNLNASPPTWIWNIIRRNNLVNACQTTGSAASGGAKINTADPGTNTDFITRFRPANTFTTGYMFTNDNAASYFLGILYFGSGGHIDWHVQNYNGAWATGNTIIYATALSYATL